MIYFCHWIFNDECWKTTCGESHCFEVGGPDENKFNYCPYCGDFISMDEDVIKSEGQLEDEQG